MVARSFPRKQICTKKTFHKNSQSRISYGCKIISSKTDLYEKIFEKIVWSKNLYGCKIISSKTGMHENKFAKNVFLEYFLWLQNHVLQNKLA